MRSPWSRALRSLATSGERSIKIVRSGRQPRSPGVWRHAVHRGRRRDRTPGRPRSTRRSDRQSRGDRSTGPARSPNARGANDPPATQRLGRRRHRRRHRSSIQCRRSTPMGVSPGSKTNRPPRWCATLEACVLLPEPSIPRRRRRGPPSHLVGALRRGDQRGIDLRTFAHRGPLAAPVAFFATLSSLGLLGGAFFADFLTLCGSRGRLGVAPFGE